MKRAIIEVANAHLAIYMPPGTGKTTLREKLLSVKPSLKILDTDDIIYSWYSSIRKDLITILKPDYDLILTNRWQLNDIDFGLFPSRSRLRANFMATDDILDLAFRVGLVRSYDQLAMAMTTPYPIHVLVSEIKVTNEGSIEICYNKLNYK